MRTLVFLSAWLLTAATAVLADERADVYLACRAGMPCDEAVAIFIASPAKDTPEFVSDLGILAVQLSRLALTDRDADAGLELIAEVLRQLDRPMANRVAFLTRSREIRRENDDESSSSPGTLPGPIFASPS